MRKLVSLLVLAALTFAPHGSLYAAPNAVLIEYWDDSEADNTLRFKHDAWQLILNKYLDDQHPSGINRFSYSEVTAADQRSLSEYLDYLQGFDPRQHSLPEQYAYWINLYNAKTVSLVINRLEFDDIQSIREIRSGLFTAGPWQRKTMKIAGQSLSLDDIEHGILRPIFRDKRIHFVLNCASLGCPNLSKTAFTASNTEAQMSKAERDFLSHPRGARIENGELILSKIFDWYGDDFANNGQELLNYIEPLVNAETAAKFENYEGVDFEYDWSLNRP